MEQKNLDLQEDMSLDSSQVLRVVHGHHWIPIFVFAALCLWAIGYLVFGPSDPKTGAQQWFARRNARIKVENDPQSHAGNCEKQPSS